MARFFAPKGRFVGSIMPNCIANRKDMSSGAKLLYAKLLSCAAEKEYCWPSQGYLADQLGTTVRSIQNQLHELLDLGLIETERKRQNGSLNYYIKSHKSLELRSVPQYATTSYECEKVSYISNLNNKNINSPLPPSSFCAAHPSAVADKGRDLSSLKAAESAKESFERLWHLWPIKQSKQTALNVWLKLWFSGKLPSFDIIHSKVCTLLEKDKRFTAYPSLLVHWLNGSRWLDEPFGDSRAQAAQVPTTEQVAKISKAEAEQMLLRFKKQSETQGYYCATQ